MKKKLAKTEISLQDILVVKRMTILEKSAQQMIYGKEGCGGTFAKNPCFD
ncbi:hypothetical protein [Aquimarina sp. AU474]|nr:hypothetical protein [Aquimarina sp. AU474]